MSRIFLKEALETVSVYWRIYRRDGAVLGFVSHDRGFLFDGIFHRAAPGMIPSAIRRTSGLELDSAEVSGVLSHDSISEHDLAMGRFDRARVAIGLVDWDTLDGRPLYQGEIGTVAVGSVSFEAELRSAKAELEKDLVPRTSPTCRARFCGPGCHLSGARFTHEGMLKNLDVAGGKVEFEGCPPGPAMLGGWVRWIDGPHAGTEMQIIDIDADALVVEDVLRPELATGARALLREGCDHTLATCHERFGNSVNFQGEPFLPGNDALIRYPVSSA